MIVELVSQISMRPLPRRRARQRVLAAHACETVGVGVPNGAGALPLALGGVWGQAGSPTPRDRSNESVLSGALYIRGLRQR